MPSLPFQFLRDPHLRRALTLWTILAAAICVKAAVSGDDYKTGGGAHSVYPVYATGSRHWWNDQPLYIDYSTTEHVDAYRYSPTFAVAFSVFACLGDRCGAMLWGVVSVAMLVWSLHVLVRDLLPGQWSTRREGGLMKTGTGSTTACTLVLPKTQSVVVPVPVFITFSSGQREGVFLTLTLVGSVIGLWSGQSNAILSAFVIFAMSAIAREKWWSAAWLLAAPVFIKLWPIAVVMLILVCWPKRLVPRFMVACLGLAVIPFFTRPFEKVLWQYHAWYEVTVHPLRDRWPGFRDAWTIWDSLWPPVDNRVYMVLQLAAAVAVLGWCLWQRRRDISAGHFLTLIYSMWVSWQLLFGPATEQLTYGIIAPAASWAVLTSFDEKRARWLTLAAWATLALLASGDIEKSVLAILPAGKALLPFGVVLFIGWLTWHERGRDRLA